MKKPLNKDTIINIGFYGGLVMKGVDAFIEFIGGIILIVLNYEGLNRLIRFIAIPELTEDPKDIAMNYFITIGQNFSINSQHSVAVYMMLHGITKLAVVWVLLTKKLWAYPLAMFVFVLFITYEMYSYMHSRSVLMLMMVIIDIAIFVMIILEYKHLKVSKI
ncbi:DUF2127 domain-containing protein [Clostridium sp.]|uniref:DUF2127 domain-containing protein n=1 Tax=Clostridium sp. TaxID=1506 RepID=UPI001A47EFD2|nr:DUF2127 domain-containing protein [Clostridium sp.]MBK5242385.1 DUF2127 domain-containing protein [Clostridium sp.]